jgi:hypothetical protein
MSKKKNTLKDLDAFLKQQAATLVAPQQLSETLPPEAPVPTPPAAIAATIPPTIPPAPAAVEPTTTPAPNVAHIQEQASPETILRDLHKLAQTGHGTFRRALYDVIIKAVEAQPKQQVMAEDKMLINTVLYLKNGENWKEAIREYWRGK